MQLDLLMYHAKVTVIPLTEEHAELARAAWRQYGKGDHPAKLNMGDCFSYALAKHFREPLLYKGDGFAKTDIPAAVTR